MQGESHQQSTKINNINDNKQKEHHHQSNIVEYKQIKALKHFSHEMPLPESVKIFSYSRKCESKKKKKLKDKFDNFKYYEDNETKQIHKILFITDGMYVDQGIYPFTQPSGQVKNFNELVNAKRVTVTEAAYIGHLNDSLVIKKMQGVKLGNDGTEFQTDDDNFELIKINNESRFNQFLKLMSFNKNSISMSIRVIIDESQGKQPQVIDYEFFFREKELAKKHQTNKNISAQKK